MLLEYNVEVIFGVPGDNTRSLPNMSPSTTRTRGSRNAREEATFHLLKALRLVIVAGGGANHSEAWREIMALSKR